LTLKTLLFGRPTRPAVAVVGGWDPPLEAHEALLRELAAYGRSHDLSSLAILIDPPPAWYIYGPAQCQVYHDVRTRVHLLRACGIDGVMILHFTKQDFDAGVAELFETLKARVALAELWLGAGQSLGRGPKGNHRAIADQARLLDIKLSVMPDIRMDTLRVRLALEAGRLQEASTLVGRPPTRARPSSGELRFAWAPGRYLAKPLRDLWSGGGPGVIEIELTRGRRGLSYCRWPDPSVPYYAFIAGPGDGVDVECPLHYRMDTALSGREGRIS
jgi:hypothetical protein